MIRETRHYWIKEGIPTKEDITDAIAAAQKHNCDVLLNWRGPGYKWHGDTYKCIITPTDNPNEIYEGLPKSYGI